MKSTVKWLIALGCCSTALAAAHTSPQQTRIFRSGTSVIHIDVSVRRHNIPVLHLDASDFQLRDNGVRQAIDALSIDAIPLDITLIFDRSSFGQNTIGDTFERDFKGMIGLMRVDDRVQVITFASEVREVITMQGTAELRQLPQLKRDPSSLGLKHAGPVSKAGLDFLHNPQLNRWCLFDALLFGLARPAELDRRHLIIVFATGHDGGSIIGDATAIDQIAMRSDAVLHAVLWNERIAGTQVISLGSLYDRIAVRMAVDATGGTLHEATDGVKAFKSILDEFRQSYVLQYTATDVPLGGWHDVVVTMPGHPDYEIHARKGYMGQ